MVDPVIIGDAELYLGDCRDILPTLGKVDAVVTDPPYGIGESAGKSKSRGKLAKAIDYGNKDWDNQPISQDAVKLLMDCSEWQIFFGGNYYALPPTSCWLVWDKVNGDNDFADCELAWTNLTKAVRQIRYLWNGMLREKGAQRGDHPTQKPIEVMKWAIGHLPDKAETVLDPYSGSGTTGVAAIQLDKKCSGIERELVYFEAMCRRIRETVGDDVGPLFGNVV